MDNQYRICGCDGGHRECTCVYVLLRLLYISRLRCLISDFDTSVRSRLYRLQGRRRRFDSTDSSRLRQRQDSLQCYLPRLYVFTPFPFPSNTTTINRPNNRSINSGTKTALVAKAMSGVPAEAVNALGASHPLKGFGDASDIAKAAVFLASEGASWISGVALPVDGGFVAK